MKISRSWTWKKSSGGCMYSRRFVIRWRCLCLWRDMCAAYSYLCWVLKHPASRQIARTIISILKMTQIRYLFWKHVTCSVPELIQLFNGLKCFCFWINRNLNRRGRMDGENCGHFYHFYGLKKLLVFNYECYYVFRCLSPDDSSMCWCRFITKRLVMQQILWHLFHKPN